MFSSPMRCMRLGERPLLRIALTLPQPAVDPGGPLPPLLELVDRQAKLAGEQLDRLALHQPQHHLALARKAPPLTRRQWALRRPTFRSWGSTCGQRGRAALALADHRPIHSVISIGLVHAALHHIGLRLDKSVSRETGCSSVQGNDGDFCVFAGPEAFVREALPPTAIGSAATAEVTAEVEKEHGKGCMKGVLAHYEHFMISG